MLAIINPHAGGGTALAKWRRIENRLTEALGPIGVLVAESRQQVDAVMPELLARGHRDFLAAGGDGTVNAVLSAVVAHAGEVLPQIRVGAVGLGSSNDFHKPFRRTIDGIPCRIDRLRAQRHDVGRLDYEDCAGAARDHYWFVNASIGIAAQANHAFNHPGRVLRGLKRVATSLAIVSAAVVAIVRNRPRLLALTVDGRPGPHLPVRNLSFVKNPHFAGRLRYDSPHLPDSGCFHVHRLGGLSRLGLLRALVRLARGRFGGGRETRSWFAHQAEVRDTGRPFLVECDGEVVEARVARFSILDRKVRLCS
jgi:diacylglycerol kinase (ATP)